MDIALFVIPKPAPNTRSMLEREPHFPPGPIVRGEGDGAGDVNLCCGDCGFAIAQTVKSADVIQAMVLRCPKCNAYNETRH